MANLMRPAPDRRSTRRAKSRSPPPAELTAPIAHQQRHQQPSAPILPSRLSNTLPPPSRAPDTPNAPATKQPSPAPAAAQKRSIAEVDTPNARPSKKAQRRSHGESPTAPNGLTKKLDPNVDHVPSGASTPRPAGEEQTPTTTMVDKKSLRSADPNSKKGSELRDIFDDYDAIITKWDDQQSNPASDEEILVVDEALSAAERAQVERAVADARTERPPPSPSHTYTPRAPFDYTPYANALPTTADPLVDDAYTKVHAKHEIKEKRERNTQKDRSQHQKATVERLVDELEGDEWPKVFKITGTADERTRWEPKRQYFLNELRIYLGKHEDWKRMERENEKSRKEKEKAKKEVEAGSKRKRRAVDDEEASDSDPKRKRRPIKEHPHHTPSPAKPRRPPRPHGFILEWEPFVLDKTKFTSFYKKGQRPASLGGKARGTRSASVPAFGVPLPGILTRIDDNDLGPALLEDNDFCRKDLPVEEDLLPDEQRFKRFKMSTSFITPEFLAENERKRRRRKRENAAKRNESHQ